MLRAVEVWHEDRWVPAIPMATRLDSAGWHGLVGYTDPLTRTGYYHWCSEAHPLPPQTRSRWQSSPPDVAALGPANL